MTALGRSRGVDSILHCFRAPVGGVFRHVQDLIAGQAARGFRVGLVCDATTGGAAAARALEALKPHCALGVHRVPFRRAPHPLDIRTRRTIARLCAKLRPSIVHGHGAKGGAMARTLPAPTVYTPHGGVLHYDPASLVGRAYFGLERLLMPSTNGLVFVSQFAAEQYREKVGPIRPPHRVIYNGLRQTEFTPVTADPDAVDFVFVGELRILKGLDVLLDAVAQVRAVRRVRVLVVGAGPDADHLASRRAALGLVDAVELSPPIYPATRAFARARAVVVPSLAESLPYIVLETVAAGVPLITTKVGGIPEIFGPYASELVPPGDSAALARAMLAGLERRQEAKTKAAALAAHVRARFDMDAMVDASLDFYAELLSAGVRQGAAGAA